MTSEDHVKELKRRILQAAYTAREGHIASAFSVLDILYILYAKVMNISPMFVKHQDRDYLLLSKGHASLALYAVLEVMGFIKKGELNTFGKGRLGGHPCEELVPGVEASTGSLGHGLPIAIGLAMSLLKEQSKSKVFCIIGDGEMNEGSIWESLLLAGHHKLSNLTLILDYNQSNDQALRLPISGRGASDILCSMGWRVSSVDGHDHNDISRAFTRAIDDRPHFIVASTVKGKGISEMEEDPRAWHHRAPTAEELALFLEELK